MSWESFFLQIVWPLFYPLRVGKNCRGINLLLAIFVGIVVYTLVLILIGGLKATDLDAVPVMEGLCLTLHGAAGLLKNKVKTVLFHGGQRMRRLFVIGLGRGENLLRVLKKCGELTCHTAVAYFLPESTRQNLENCGIKIFFLKDRDKAAGSFLKIKEWMAKRFSAASAAEEAAACLLPGAPVLVEDFTRS